MMTDESIKADFDFFIGEIVRFGKMSIEELISNIKDEPFHEIIDADGNPRTIGRSADERLFSLTEKALDESPFCQRVAVERAFQSVKIGLGKEYLHKGYKEPSGAEIRVHLMAWIASAGSDCRLRTHLIPCNIGLRGTQNVKFGPVKLTARAEAWSELSEDFEAYCSSDDEKDKKFRLKNFEAAEEYYSAFMDIAEVSVADCDDPTSKAAAAAVVQATLDIIHVMAGAGYTSQMRGGGPAIKDRRGEIIIDDQDGLQILWSARWGGASLGDKWWDWIVDPIQRPVVEAIGVALQSVVERREPRLLAARFLDSCAWYGDASREPSEAAAVVKYLTAMERLLWAGEKGPGVTKRISNRAAALCFTTDTWDMDGLADEVREAYSLRSAILHGRVSKRDRAVRKGLRLCERVSRDLLITWIERFGPGYEKEVTVEGLGTYLDNFVKNAQADCRKHRKTE